MKKSMIKRGVLTVSCLSAAIAVLSVSVGVSSGQSDFAGEDDVARGRPFEVKCVSFPSAKVDIGPQIGGIIEEIVREGAHVRKGDVLFMLNDELIAAEVEIAKASAEFEGEVRRAESLRDYYESELARAEGLSEGESITESELETARYQATAAGHDLETATFNLRLRRLQYARDSVRLRQHTVTAPFDGYVHRVLREKGGVVEPLTPVLTFIRMDMLHVNAYVPAWRHEQMSVGDKAAVRFGLLNEREFECTVIQVGKYAEEAEELAVKLELPNNDAGLPAGLHGMARFETDRSRTRP